MAVTKVDELTGQLDELRSGKVNLNYPPQVVELEKLRRELAYRRQLNEQQNNMIAQQRAQLSMGQEEMARIDRRIAELQDPRDFVAKHQGALHGLDGLDNEGLAAAGTGHLGQGRVQQGQKVVDETAGQGLPDQRVVVSLKQAVESFTN